ncbi:MAG: metal-dependent transcriptional regulator [Candidatus Caldarchaeum sp.]
MERSQLSSVMEDYLKTIYHLLSENGRANTNELAKLLKVSPPTVTQMVKKLADARLVSYSPYRGFLLTDLGEKIALEVIRHHRLIERYLHEALGVPWDKVHEEAERWEHVISEDVEKRMDKVLNYPKHDPHGSPIPNEQLVMEVEDLVPLGELSAGESGVLREVPDEDSDFLSYLDGLNLLPNTIFEVEGTHPFEGTISLRVYGKSVTIGKETAMRIRVKRSSTKG